MIPRRLRLPRYRIEYLFRKGKKIASDYFTIRYSPAKAGDPNRFCVVISAATEKSAVKRNRLRRQVYETARLREKHETAIQDPKFDTAVICKKKALQLDNKSISEDLNALFSKLSR
jgi:ribonuclease P protein component